MEDAREDELLHEIFITHIHMFWKYISIFSSKVYQFVVMSSVDSLKNEIMQPISFTILTMAIILLALFIQIKLDWFQRAGTQCLKLIKLSKPFIDNSLTNLISLSGGDNIYTYEEYRDGIMGACALQGQRSTMEDRLSNMQNVELLDGKVVSFFAVYDGHGGEFVVEYVKQNLFTNLIKKIKEIQQEESKRNKAFKCSETNMKKISSETELKSTKNDQVDSEDMNVVSRESEEKVPPAIMISRTFVETVSCDSSNQDTSTKAPEDCSKNSEKLQNESCFENHIKDDKSVTESKDCNKLPDTLSKTEPISEDSQPLQSMKGDPYTSIKHKRKITKQASPKLPTKETKLEDKSSTLKMSYIDSRSNINFGKLLKDHILAIDKKIVEMCVNKKDLSGTTAIIAILDEDHLVIGNVGDSRAVLGDKKGAAIPLSFDHKPNQLKETRRINEAGGFVTFAGVWRVAGVLATSRAIGDFILKVPQALVTAEPDILTFNIKEHKAQFLILASDGLWDVCSNEEAVEFIRNHFREIDYGAKSLAQHAFDRGSQDNITVMVLKLNG